MQKPSQSNAPSRSQIDPNQANKINMPVQNSLLDPNSSTQPSSADRQAKQNSYFKSILQKRNSQLLVAQRALQSTERSLSNQILVGKYDIKSRDWPGSEEEAKGSLQLSQSMIRTKKQLEEELQNVESRLKQQNSIKTSRIITQEERLSFLQKMENERKEILERKKEAARQEEEHRKQEEKKAREKLEQAEAEKKNRRKEELMQKLKQLQEQKKSRIDAYTQQEAVLKQKIAEKTMAERIENQYNLKQNEMLEEKKKRLAEIRAFHKPIDRTELDAHSLKLDQLQQLRIEAAKNKSASKPSKPAANFYKSVFYKKVQHEEKVFLESRHEQELSKLKQVRDKLKKFSEHIRSDYKPSIDEKKAEEIKFRSESLKHRSMSSTNQRNAETPRKIGLRYLQFCKTKVEQHQKLLGAESHEEESQETQHKKNTDYLAELRQKNKRNGVQSIQAFIDSLDKKQFTKEEKAQKILQLTERLEQKAKRREEIQKIGGVNASEELDSLYLQAIEAKLSLLEDY